MTVAQASDRLETVKNWLRELDDRWIIIQATEAGGIELTPQQVETIAQQCEWAELDTQTDLPYTHQGYLYSTGLIIGQGIDLEAYQNAPGHQAFFVNAYLREEYSRRKTNSELVRQTIQQWIKKTQGWTRLRSVSNGSVEVSESEIVRLASRHDTQWACLSTANAQTPFMHRESLMLAWNAPDGSLGYHLFVAVQQSSQAEEI